MYVGETLRITDDRVEEHERHVAKGEIRSSAVAEHVWNEDHRIDSAAGTLSRRVKESLHIVKEKTTMNTDEGLKLSAVWKSLFI